MSGANDNVRNALVVYAENIKTANDDGVFCGLPITGIQSLFGVTTNNASTAIAVGVDFSRKIKAAGQGQLMEWSLIDVLAMMEVNIADIAALPRLTEEEFYTL